MIHDTPLGPTLLAACLFLLAVIAFYAVRPAEDRRAVMGIAVAAYLIKAALVPLYFWALLAADLEGFAYWDSIEYHLRAQEMALEINYGLLHQAWGWHDPSRGYNIVCAYLYAWFGSNTLIPRFFNAAISSLALLYLFRLGKHFFDARIARLAVLMMAFLPFTILVVINQAKDPLAQFLALFAFYHGVIFLRLDRRWPGGLLMAALALITIYSIRSGFILPFLAVMFVSFLLARRNIAVAMVAAVPMVLVVVGLQFTVPEESEISVETSLERLEGKQQLAEARAAESEGLLRFAHITSPLQLYKLPLTALLMLIVPFPPPLAVTYLPQFLFAWANLFTLVLYPRMAIGILSILKQSTWREKVPLFIYPGIYLLLIGSLHPSITRYRETVFPVLLLFVAAGLQQPRNRLISGIIYAGLVVFGAFTYAVRFSR